MKIGVLGGTFDPVHLGHIMMAEEAIASLGLASVLMVPAGQPISKRNRPITASEHRLQMLKKAVAENQKIKISTIEIDRKGPSYTADTIAEMKENLGSGTEIYFILGWDSLGQLSTWHEPKRLASMCYLVVVPRPGYAQPDLKALEEDIPGISKKMIFLEKPRVDISATAIRGMVKRGEAIDHLVPGVVAKYIHEHNLYR